jgi:hypothetical protein
MSAKTIQDRLWMLRRLVHQVNGVPLTEATPDMLSIDAPSASSSRGPHLRSENVQRGSAFNPQASGADGTDRGHDDHVDVRFDHL